MASADKSVAHISLLSSLHGDECTRASELLYLIDGEWTISAPKRLNALGCGIETFYGEKGIISLIMCRNTKITLAVMLLISNRKHTLEIE